MCARARTARENVHAIFPYFFGQFFDILKPFLTENDKNGGRIPDRYGQDTTF